MNSVYLIVVAFSVINIAAGKPLGNQMHINYKFHLCEKELSDMVDNICDIYRSYPEKTYNVEKVLFEPTMDIHDDDKNFPMNHMCCNNMCVTQDDINNYCLERDQYKVIQHIKLRKYLDIKADLDTTDSTTNTP